MRIHEVADIFPLMDKISFEELKNDISENGLLEPIWTYQDQIIDGRNRYNACKKLKIEPVFQEWNGKGSLVAFVISLNLHRRHLNSAQKAAIAVEILPMFEKEAKKRQLSGLRNVGNKLSIEKATLPKREQKNNQSRDQAAIIVGTGSRYISDLKKIKLTDPQAFEEIKSGKRCLKDVKAEQDEKERKRIQAENLKTFQETQNSKSMQNLFSTIIIDPPCKYGQKDDRDHLYIKSPSYHELSFNEIKRLPVRQFATKNAHIYLWVKNGTLPRGFDLLKTWGFKYITTITWVKEDYEKGRYFKNQSEHVLFGVKGELPLKSEHFGTIFYDDVIFNTNNEKPSEFYALVKTCSPGPYLEMFTKSHEDREEWIFWNSENQNLDLSAREHSRVVAQKKKTEKKDDDLDLT